jgi:hypothetical protein
MSGDRWSLRNIYLYLVCLITLIMVIVAAVGLVRSAVDLAYPDPTIFIEKAPLDDTGKPIYTAEQWAAQQDSQRASTRRYAILEIVGNAAMLLIAGPLYVYHWRKIETERPAEAPHPLPTA